MKPAFRLPGQPPTLRFLAFLFLQASLQLAVAQPTITLTVPSDGATGVSPSAAVVFTFSTAMNPTFSAARFIDTTTGFPASAPPVWSAGNTVLTCTPSPAFASGDTIQWYVYGQDTGGNPLNGGTPVIGSFTTGAGGGGGGSGTNAYTSFVVGKAWLYNQPSTAAPMLDTNTPYVFEGLTSLASNRTATAITLTMPTAGISNLIQNVTAPEDYYLFSANTNLTTFNATFPPGSYRFDVYSNAADQQVTVNLPNYAQPNAPHVSNYTAAQAVNPTQPFILTWDAFTGGGSTDYVSVAISGLSGNLFETPGYGQAGALTGSATQVTIPANTLAANSNYTADLTFFHVTFATNGTTLTEAFVASYTTFTISTASSSAAAPVLTNAAWSGGMFGFDILTAPSQTLTVVYNTNLNNAFSSWPILLTTNSPGSIVHISDPHSSANKTLFYRARNGP